MIGQVAGGDSTVGWVLGCLGELNKHNRLPVVPVGVVPLGIENDLSRSFGWVGFLLLNVEFYKKVFFCLMLNYTSVASLVLWSIYCLNVHIFDRVVLFLLPGNQPLKNHSPRLILVKFVVWIGKCSLLCHYSIRDMFLIWWHY